MQVSALHHGLWPFFTADPPFTKLIFHLEVSWYSLEQYIGCIIRQAFNYCCSLLQVQSDLKKTTAVVESLSNNTTNVLFQRIPAYFKDLINSMRNRHQINISPYAFHQRGAPLTPWGHSPTLLLSIV